MAKFRGFFKEEGSEEDESGPLEIEKPYSGPDDPDLPDNVAALSQRLREIWVNVFNSAYSSCIADGGSTSDCDGSAIAQAWGVVNQNRD